MFLLSAIVLVPAIAALALLFFPSRTPAERDRIRTFALAAAALVTALDVVMWYGFRDQSGSFAYEETRSWLPGIGASYHLGVDGVSMSLLLLASVLFLAAAFVSNRVRDDVKGFFILLLLLETGVNGSLAALDFFLFFLFWQLQVLPLGFLTWRWAGNRRAGGAWKLLAVESVGSAFLLLAVLILYFKSPNRTFDMATLHNLQIPGSIAGLVFVLFLIPFALRLPVVPFHSWFVDAQAEAATPVAIVLGGIVTRLGAYGLYRVNLGQLQATLHRASGAVAVLAVITVLWTALAAFREDDIRRVVGYLVVSHGGLLVLAVASASPTALNGGVLLIVADGLAAAMLIILANSVAERAGTRSITAMGGLARRMPKGAVLWLLAALAALGLPGLAGFVGEFLIFLGSYPSQRLMTSLAILGTLLMAVATLWTFQRIFFGPPLESDRRFRDIGSLELGTSVGLFCLLVLMGVLPAILMDSINFSVLTLLSGSGG
jgi:NADH-quinone oxidoreductase subunit M